LAYTAWPTWERTQVSETLASLLDAYRNYFRAVCNTYIQPDAAHFAVLDRPRQDGRLARSNAEASLIRLRTEPGFSSKQLAQVDSILANSHRFIHAAMSLEAGLLTSHPATPRDAFRRFADDADITLYLLAAALRGSKIVPGSFPNLREDHNALLESGDPD